MDNLKDASNVTKTYVDWWALFEAGDAEFFQGEPGKPDAFLLPDFSEKEIVPIDMLGMCIIHNMEIDEWLLAYARQNVDAWEVAAAYYRLGYQPPLILINQLTTSTRISIAECFKILDAYRKGIEEHLEDPSEMGKMLLHIKSNLHGSGK
jgi:hypothetical protein